MHGFIQTIPHTVDGCSELNNRGLYTTVARSKGEILCRLGGEVVYHQDDNEFLGSTEWNAIDDYRVLLRRKQTSYFLINHSESPNLTINASTSELRAKCNIAKGEELLLDYLENGFPQAYLQTERCDYLR